MKINVLALLYIILVILNDYFFCSTESGMTPRRDIDKAMAGEAESVLFKCFRNIVVISLQILQINWLIECKDIVILTFQVPRPILLTLDMQHSDTLNTNTLAHCCKNQRLHSHALLN